MKDTEMIIAIIVAALVGLGVMFKNKIGLKIQLVLLIAATLYMLVHAILHPESDSKFFAFIGFIFIVQTFKTIKQQSRT